MLNVVEKDKEYIHVRLSHLMKFQHHQFRERCLVVDTHGENMTHEFSLLLRQVVNEGLIDSWKVVDYSPEYIAQVKKMFHWNTNFVTQG